MIEKNLDPLSAYFYKKTLENDTIILSYMSTSLQLISFISVSFNFTFQYSGVDSFVISFIPLAGFDLAFRYRLPTSVQCLLSAIFRVKMICLSVLAFGRG